MDTGFFLDWIAGAAAVISSDRDHLTQLDSAIGDADHGVNLDRGFAAACATLSRVRPASPGAALKLTGLTLIPQVGGASGPLYGAAFRAAGQALGPAAEVDLRALAAALEAALAGVQELGAAREGEKTMVDALAPASRALNGALARGRPVPDALAALTDAAEAGARATILMQARKGRASYLGPRSVGHEDPGARSASLILGALRDAAADRD
jgi:dihydroxyacetone kinase-like protein